jgi:hypothetical protein
VLKDEPTTPGAPTTELQVGAQTPAASFTVARAAWATRCGVGTYTSSSAGLNGTGVCGAVTSLTGALRYSRACVAARVAMSAAAGAGQ